MLVDTQNEGIHLVDQASIDGVCTSRFRELRITSAIRMPVGVMGYIEIMGTSGRMYANKYSPGVTALALEGGV